MQSYDGAPMDAVKKLSVCEKSCPIKGKENSMTSSACLQQSKQKLAVQNQNAAPRAPPQSKLPVLSKSKAPPDFQKMHQTWQTHFQRGKAVSKKSCTRPQPFNFSQRGERSRVQNTGLRVSGESSSGQSPCNSSASCKSREPLAEVLGQNKKESSIVKGSEVDFKVDPAALASILSNIGVSAAPVGKVSLAQRVPIRAASIAHPLGSKNTIARSSMYTLPSSHTGPANLDRMSCFSRIRVNEQKSARPLHTHSIPKATVKEPEGLKKDQLHPQENPVLQQMNPPVTAPPSDTACSLNTQEGHLTKLTSVSVRTDQTSTALSTAQCETSSTGLIASTERQDSVKKTDTCSEDFVADSQALASILSNTELSNTNCGKLSLARRVPMQGRSSMLKSSMTTPKPACGPMSATVPLKDLMFSPCRVPLVTSDKSSGGSARRVLQPQSFTVFSQPYSVTSKQPVFPKTPKAMALEKANKSHENDKTVVQTTSKSTVKWADELSPSPVSQVLCERDPDMEEVAMRLFLDEGTGDTEKKKKPTVVSNPAAVSDSPVTSAPEQKEVVHLDAHGANVGNFQLHSQICLVAPSSQPSASVVSSIKSSMPLSFLSHPAVQALQTSTLGPCSLPDIARLRLQAAVSAKQRFWESRLDEECAFYTSRGASGSVRSCTDPVSLFLEKQEDMHFTPICPGKS